MAVIKEWECAAHGYFDAAEARCPYGCATEWVQRVYLTAPAIGSEGTKRSDQTLRALANDFGMTDMKNGKDGMAVAQATPAASSNLRPSWQSLGKEFDVRGLGVEPGNALAGLKSAMKGPRPSEIIGRYDGK